MEITICGSISETAKMLPIIEKLEQQGHKCFWSKGMEKYANGDLEWIKKVKGNHAQIKQDYNTIKEYYNFIKNSDCILVCNFYKNNIPGYIGGSALMEIGFAHILDKPIYLLNPVPELLYKDEIIAVKPIIINNDLSIIK